MTVDDDFYNRADAVIHLANKQCEIIGKGKVSASLMYATARFGAWLTACGFSSSAEMKAAKNEAMEYLVTQYRAMLEENISEYIENFESYMKRGLQ
ncbi:MAG: DUF3144 domain-containing protein [Verrucomicrobia bacterium]|nr:MAG: DUF3144 domain-containing protein [Verrucomicrobiota bacterium]